MTEIAQREPNDRRAQDLMTMIDYLDKDIRNISPTGAHFLQMAKVALANPHWDRSAAQSGAGSSPLEARGDDAGE